MQKSHLQQHEVLSIHSESICKKLKKGYVLVACFEMRIPKRTETDLIQKKSTLSSGSIFGETSNTSLKVSRNNPTVKRNTFIELQSNTLCYALLNYSILLSSILQ